MVDLKVVPLPGMSGVSEALQTATNHDLSEVLVLGWTKDGKLFCRREPPQQHRRSTAFG